MLQLDDQVVEIKERAGEEEVLAVITIRPLELSLCFSPIRTAGLELEAKCRAKSISARFVGDAAASFADDDCLHGVVKDLLRDAAIRRAEPSACPSALRSDQPVEAGALQMPFSYGSQDGKTMSHSPRSRLLHNTALSLLSVWQPK
jgi:hypothetical protein